MKKQLLIAAIAATMSAGSFADISIKGDAHIRYSHWDNDTTGVTSNSTGQRVRLHVTGKSGGTTVKLGLRNDGGTRVSAGDRCVGDAGTRGANEDKACTGSGRGINGGELATDYLFITTKIGALDIKVGDWWDTTGLGLVRKGQANPDQAEISTKIGGWKVSLETGPDDSDVTWGAEGKLGGWDLDFEYNTADNSGYLDVAIKGKFGNVGAAVEVYNSDSNDVDANVVHLWTKASGITWHIARAEWEADQRPATQADVDEDTTGKIELGTLVDGGNRANNSKFSPLGVSILGQAPGVNGNIAIGNVNGKNQGDTTVTGVRADAKVAGMGVQVAVGNLEIGATDESFNDIIVTRSLGKGSNIKFSTGSWNDVRTSGIKVSVKF